MPSSKDTMPTTLTPDYSKVPDGALPEKVTLESRHTVDFRQRLDEFVQLLNDPKESGAKAEDNADSDQVKTTLTSHDIHEWRDFAMRRIPSLISLEKGLVSLVETAKEAKRAKSGESSAGEETIKWLEDLQTEYSKMAEAKVVAMDNALGVFESRIK